MSIPGGAAMPPTRLYILREIFSGFRTPRSISNSLNLSIDSVRMNLRYLESQNYVRMQGLRNRYFLTEKGINTLTKHDLMPDDATRFRNQSRHDRSEIRHAVRMRTAFGVSFGAVIGFFAAYLVVSLVASAAYYAIYHFYLKDAIPADLLPYVPLDDFLVDLALGLLTTLAVFLPFRSKLNMAGLLGGGR